MKIACFEDANVGRERKFRELRFRQVAINSRSSVFFFFFHSPMILGGPIMRRRDDETTMKTTSKTVVRASLVCATQFTK